ncbi:MAG TPA: M48 family metalloprotease [Candidatus Acidoferrales bacterium]|nr:M48 family metalloprotease [Candidatus Acidoferrales bacterium]
MASPLFSSRCTTLALRTILLIVGLCAPVVQQCSSASFAADPSSQQSIPTSAASRTPQKVTRYTLPPDRLRQAVELARSGDELYFTEFGVTILLLVILLKTGVVARFSSWAERSSRFRILQASIFAALLLGALALSVLPLHAWGHVLGMRYNLSVEGWGPWLLDWCKGQAIAIAIGAFAAWIVGGLLRRSPRRWWFVAWLIALPLIVFAALLEPVVVEPLFYKFEPLAASHPKLALQIQELATRAGAQIPQDHMYEMLASQKLNELNAYVTGIGASKRVVVWDTLFAHMTEDEILLVVGHELGHYVLGHVWKGIAASAAGLFFGLWFLAAALRWTVRRWGSGWRILDLNGWGALGVLWLLGSLLLFLSTPLDSAVSRYVEHQADVFGLEITHGVVPDASQVAAQSDQILGEVDLEEPDPSPLVVFWLYDHPPIAERIQFDLEYDPWAPGHSPEFVRH